MGSLLDILFECNLRKNMGWLSACNPHLLYYPWQPGKRDLQTWLFLFPNCSMTGHDSTCYTALESYQGDILLGSSQSFTAAWTQSGRHFSLS